MLIVATFISCSSGYEISDNLKKSIQQNSIEQIRVQLNQQEKKYSVKNVRFSDQFFTVDNTVYNLSAVKSYYQNGKEIVIVL